MLAELRKNNLEQPVLKIGSQEYLLTNGFRLHLGLEALRSLNTGLEIKFENFRQLRNLINKINTLELSDLSNISTKQLLNELERRVC